MTASLLLKVYSRTRDDTHLAGTLGAAVHRPLIFVLVHNAVVDADSNLDVHLMFQQLANLGLWRREGGRGKKGLIRTKDGKVSLCQSSSTNDSLTDTVIKTSLDSSGAVQIQPTANQHICVFRWVSLRFWPQAAITVTSGCTRRILKLEAKGKMERRGGNSGRGQSLVELTTLRRPMDSFSTTIPSPLTSLNMLAMSTQDRPQTAWTSGWRGGKKTVNDFISF